MHLIMSHTVGRSFGLAEGGTGLGTCGLAEPVLWGLARDAGFTDMRSIDTDDPFNCLYELTP